MSKLNKLRGAMRDVGIAAVLVTDELNIRYTTGLDISDAYLLVGSSFAYLLTDFRYREIAEKTLKDSYEVVTPAAKLDFIKDILSGSAITELGFEGVSTSYAFYSRLCDKLGGVSIVDVGELFAQLRVLKDEDEIEKIAKAQDIADLAFGELLTRLTPSMTEIEVAAELEYLMRKAGSEGAAFQTIAVSGDASALPHGVPRNVKLKRGFLTMDFGAKHAGYCSDMTRTVVIGKADADLRRVYDTVLSAQLAALEYLKVGRDAGEADATARRIIDAEYKDAFGHSLGHGVGLLVHEAPALSPRSFSRMLKSGNVVTVEPGIYLYGKYGCRIEDMVAIRDEGILNFTHSPKDLIEIF